MSENYLKILDVGKKVGNFLLAEVKNVRRLTKKVLHMSGFFLSDFDKRYRILKF